MFELIAPFICQKTCNTRRWNEKYNSPNKKYLLRDEQYSSMD